MIDFLINTKKRLLFQFIFLAGMVMMSSCFTFDKIPEIKITIDETLQNKIKRICIIDTTKEEKYNQIKCLDVNQSNELSFFTYEQKHKIFIKFIDSTEYRSNFIDIKEFTNKIRISKQKNEIKIENVKISQFRKKAPLIFIVFIILWITRIPISLLIVGPEDKKRFLLTGTIVTIIYLLALICVFYLNIVLLYPFYFVMIAADCFVYSKDLDNKVWKGIVASIISNIVYLTIGQFIITFAFMWST